MLFFLFNIAFEEVSREIRCRTAAYLTLLPHFLYACMFKIVPLMQLNYPNIPFLNFQCYLQVFVHFFNCKDFRLEDASIIREFMRFTDNFMVSSINRLQNCSPIWISVGPVLFVIAIKSWKLKIWIWSKRSRNARALNILSPSRNLTLVLSLIYVEKNLSVLTPKGLYKRIFKLLPFTFLQIYIPILYSYLKPKILRFYEACVLYLIGLWCQFLSTVLIF